VIALSPMGLFSNFGIYSAAMIALSLVASLVLTTAALGILAILMRDNDSITGIQLVDE
jgi:predicted RND superfamily exporter protein